MTDVSYKLLHFTLDENGPRRTRFNCILSDSTQRLGASLLLALVRLPRTSLSPFSRVNYVSAYMTDNEFMAL